MNIGSNLKLFGNILTLGLKHVLRLMIMHESYKSDGSFTSLHSEMVNMFNNYFSRVSTCEDDFIPTPHNDDSPLTIDTLVITPQLVFTSKLSNLKVPGPGQLD